jgi:hypothetical protein
MNEDTQEAIDALREVADKWESGEIGWFGNGREHTGYEYPGRAQLCAAMALPSGDGPRLIARTALLAAAGPPGENLVYWNDYVVSGLPEVIRVFRAAADQLEAKDG